MLTGIARATVIGVAIGRRTRYHPHVTIPAKQVRAVPLPPAGTTAAEQPRSSPQPHRRPRRPRQRPRQQSCHGLCFIPRRSRAFDASHAPRQRLPQACAPGRPDGLRGVEHPASQAGKLDSLNLQRAPRLSLSGPSGRPSSCGLRSRRRDRGGTRCGVHRAACCALLPRHGFSGSFTQPLHRPKPHNSQRGGREHVGPIGPPWPPPTRALSPRSDGR